jgi:hypothetical protein
MQSLDPDIRPSIETNRKMAKENINQRSLPPAPPTVACRAHPLSQTTNNKKAKNVM